MYQKKIKIAVMYQKKEKVLNGLSARAQAKVEVLKRQTSKISKFIFNTEYEMFDTK